MLTMLNPNTTAFYEYSFHISRESAEWNMKFPHYFGLWKNQANSDTWKQILREESVILKIAENNTYWPGYSPWVGKKVNLFQKYI